MSVVDRAPYWALAVAVAVGLGLIVFAIFSDFTGAILFGLAGLSLAGKSAITLARRSGATDQPQ